MRRVAGDEGAIAILVALMAIFLFAMGAIVVDLGYARMVRSDSQSAADAAALAGAGALYNGSSSPRYISALRAAQSSAQKNYGVPTSSWNASCVATPGTISDVTWDNGARSGTTCLQFGHRGTEPVSLFFAAMPIRHVTPAFGGISDYGGFDLQGQAIAGSQTIVTSECGFCVLNSLSIGPNGSVSVTGGSSLGAASIEMPGDIHPTLKADPPGQITYGSVPESPTPVTGPAYSPDPPTQAPVTNPLLSARAPDSQLPSRLVDTCDGGRVRRGIYADLTITGNCTLRAGVTTINGALVIEAGADLSGPTAALLLGDFASIDVEGSLHIGGAPDGFSFYTSSSQQLILAGDGEVVFGGDVSAANAEVIVSTPHLRVDGLMVVGAMTLSPSSEVSSVEVHAAGLPVTRHGALGLVQ